jgi:hypothetical protein
MRKYLYISHAILFLLKRKEQERKMTGLNHGRKINVINQN